MVELIIDGMINAASPMNLFFMFIGLVAGAVIGCLPGLSATMAMAILVPFTFTMDPATGLVMLGAIFMGAMFGGSVSAILLNTPGTPAAVATTFDGYPMTTQGKSKEALIGAAVASSFGGFIGAIMLLVLTPPLASAALKFGPPEYFWLAIFGLTTIASLVRASMLKGLMGGMLGLLISTIGIAPVGGVPRFTMGFSQLQIGIHIIVALIGLFCIPEVIKQLERGILKLKSEVESEGSIMTPVIQVLKNPINVIRSGVIGGLIGTLPGAGANVGGLVAYSEAKRWSHNAEQFGKGNIEGVIASESANNSAVSGSLVPLLSLGIPGAPPVAILLGALLIHGIQPGPELFVDYASVAYTFMASLAFASIILFPVGLFGGKILARIMDAPINLLMPVIVFLCIIGTFAVQNTYINVYIMLIFGLCGYITDKIGLEAAPIVLGLILGPIAEQGLVQSMLISKAQGGLAVMLFTRPISIVLIVLCILSVSWPIIQRIKGK
jgi:putative tricarboxylic transport membrane protein